ncbi:Gryzun, putative trafficking through golgi-domain-containing protein [Mycotypha africana]|uniref:Gryzun, putative trafficking through golgi-domain-containing protein n=1 Tax=Mycotypha africana TaxID=64632 RepID=UPI0023008242|nr:Gryzun, putative trafficking through golgi-domain-containing protein [Mycotypha africana]KAI8970457.1 Gryzun, putative trafficking through golgi-domain-containing protein [Mycotypha africana]
MYTYPHEYLLHPVPVMAIYGLSAVTTDDSLYSNKNSAGKEGTVELTPAITDDHNINTINEALTKSHIENNASTASTAASNTRLALIETLTDVMMSNTESTTYEATRFSTGNSQAPPLFRVITVSKDYVLPQKPQPAAPGLLPPNSNLSPLTQTSPLYPDGIMTTLWIKKHLYLPSVIVGFYELWDWDSTARPTREIGPLSSQVLIDPTERQHDDSLANEINSRRKYFQEKGIKFAAVIILKQRYYDQSVEERLAAIRKQSGLDTKTSFFTVAPGSTAEIQEFVNGLYRVLYEPAMQFYSNCLKKVRKKKSKLPSPASMPKPAPDLSSTEPQPLSVMGWMLRYEYKAAFFHEIKQEIEGALKSFEAAYGILSEMLLPTASVTTMGNVNLVIHSNRWEEARILIDCINLKICRFHLYLNDSAAALAQLNGHLHMFQSYAPSWGMAEQTFEYWAWLSTQYRIFADIIDTAVQAGYKIPVPTAYLVGSSDQSGSPLMAASSTSSGQITSTSGCNPGTVLQHPGFYYHLAAMCCAERRRKFLEIEKLNSAGLLFSNDNMKVDAAILQKERTVDHSTLTVELLTKSCEQFKRYRNGRMTLYLAAEIAGTYYETGRYEMALKFFERIGKTYRKEKWHMVSTSILRWSLRCAKELEYWEKAVECLVELMCDDLPMVETKRQDIQKELTTLIFSDSASPSPKAEERTVLHLDMDQINPFISCKVQMKKKVSFVGSPVQYQVVLQANKTSPCTPFRFQAMKIVFNDPQYNIILKDCNAEDDMQLTELIDITESLTKTTGDNTEYTDWFTAEADLRVAKNQIKAFQGTIIPQHFGELKILSVSLEIITTRWCIELNYSLDKPSDMHNGIRRKWLENVPGKEPVFSFLDGRGYLLSTNVMQKPPNIDIKFEYVAPALLNELFKVEILITSSEEETIDVILGAEIKNVESTVPNDYIIIEPEQHEQNSTAEVSLGHIKSRQTLRKAVYIHCAADPGTRTISFTVKYSIVSQPSAQIICKTETIRIPFIAAFDVNFELLGQTESSKEAFPELEKSELWLLSSSVHCLSTCELEIESLQYEQAENYSESCLSLSLLSKIDNLSCKTWRTGHMFRTNYLFRLTTSDIFDKPAGTVPAGNMVINWKRAENEGGQYYKTVICLPNIQMQQPKLTVLADIPSELFLGEPFTLTYTVYNPTESLADYTASIEISDAFVFSGYKQFRGRVLPFSKKLYQYTCYPLVAGQVRLPRLKLIGLQRQLGEREIPIELVGAGSTLIAMNNELQVTKHVVLTGNINTDSSSLTPVASSPQPMIVFVNAKRSM